MVQRRTIHQDNFDSEFRPAGPGRPAELVIRLRVRLLARDPLAPATSGQLEHFAPTTAAAHIGRLNDAQEYPFRCRSWLAPEFVAFSAKFKQMVELVWNNQLILLPPSVAESGDVLSDADYLTFISRRGLAAHVRCGFEIELVPAGSASTPHATIEAVRLWPKDDEIPPFPFRAFASRITNEDVEFTRPPGQSFMHVTAAHEVGHWLGRDVPASDPARFLHHIDWQKCSAYPDYVPGSDCEYGRTLSRRMALMGSGSLLTDYEAGPWLLRIRRHTQVLFGWKLIHRIHFNNFQVPISDRQKRVAAANPSVPP